MLFREAKCRYTWRSWLDKTMTMSEPQKRFSVCVTNALIDDTHIDELSILVLFALCCGQAA